MTPQAQAQPPVIVIVLGALFALTFFVLVILPLLYSLLWAGPRAQLYQVAIRNLLQHRRRTSLLGGAIALVTALLVILVGLSEGVNQTLLRSATTLMSGHVNVAGFFKLTPGASAPLVSEYPKVMEVVKATLPTELDYMVQRGRGWAKLISETGALQAGLAGVDIQTEQGFRDVVQLREGDLDALKEPGTALIFADQAKKLEVGVGDVLTISAPTLRGSTNTADVRVVAIAKDIGLLSQFNIFTDAGTVRRLYQLNENTTGALQIYLKDIRTSDAVMEKLRTALTGAGYSVMDYDPQPFFVKFERVNREAWTGQQLDLTKWKDEVSFVDWVLKALNAVIYLLTLILVVIIAVGIMNTLWIAIRERTREIGTLRAIGMQRRYVMATFVIEAFTLSAVSTLLGAVLGWSICLLLDAANIPMPLTVQLFLMSDTLTFAVETQSVLSSILLIGFCTTAIALIPSYLAARMKPINAMHQVG
ncbi:MAG: FtsX-like permease family protein [Myxococcota bacterium]|nr:FtsX-like permease family protein [Myxococcota bacterium]